MEKYIKEAYENGDISDTDLELIRFKKVCKRVGQRLTSALNALDQLVQKHADGLLTSAEWQAARKVLSEAGWSVPEDKYLEGLVEEERLASAGIQHDSEGETWVG